MDAYDTDKAQACFKVARISELTLSDTFQKIFVILPMMVYMDEWKQSTCHPVHVQKIVPDQEL